MKENNDLKEQKAPLKNTDNAFVKVGEDGKPKFDKEQTSAAEDKDQGISRSNTTEGGEVAKQR